MGQLVLADVVLSNPSDLLSESLQTGCTSATIQLLVTDEMKLRVIVTFGQHMDGKSWRGVECECGKERNDSGPQPAEEVTVLGTATLNDLKKACRVDDAVVGTFWGKIVEVCFQGKELPSNG